MNVADNKPQPVTMEWPGDFMQQPQATGRTMQEYHASQAIVRGKGPGRDQHKSLCDRDKDGPAITLGRYSAEGSRKSDNLAEVALMCLDLDDHRYTFEEVAGVIERAGLEAVVLTSYSHHPDYPRTRVYLPFAQPLTGATEKIKICFEQIRAFLNGLNYFNGSIAKESEVIGQLWFLPRVPVGGEPFFQHKYFQGVMLDPADFLVPARENETQQVKRIEGDGGRPGDDYNSREICTPMLLSAGWRTAYERAGNIYLTRPGKEYGVSGVVFASGVFHCFTSAPEAAPFDASTSYTAFSVYTLLEHQGDFGSAAKSLSALGYGEWTSGGSIAEGGGCEAWPVPLPLPEGLPTVKQLDEQLIPPPLRGWLLDIAERMQIPPDFSTATAIVALGSIIGRGCGIHPKQHDDWLVVPNLWGAVIGRPSMMKTPAMSEAFKPIDRLEIDAKEQHQSSATGHDFDQFVKEEAEKSIKAAIKKAMSAGDIAAVDRLRDQYRNDQLSSSAEPVRRRFFTSDATPEKICHLLNENPRGMLLKRDELIGWLSNLDRDGRENARSMFLEGWNGTGRYSYDTIKDGTIDVEALCLSVFGAITPGRLASYIYQANKGGAGDDGLMQRFQLAVWPDAPADWKMIDRWPDTTEKNWAYAIFSALAGKIPGAEITGNADIPALRFAPDAQLVFNDWLQELENRLRKTEGLTPALESHLAKYRSLMPSLALIYHLVDVVDGTTPPGPVSVRAAAMAAGMCEYLESHALRIYSGGTSPGMESAREIIRRIQKGDIKDGSTIREIWRPQWSRLTTSEEVLAGLEVLQLHDWLTVKTVKTGGRPTQTISLNPRIPLSV